MADRNFGDRDRDRDRGDRGGDRSRDRDRDRDRDREGGEGGEGPGGGRRGGYLHRSENGTLFVDYKATEDLRRCMTPNGKIYSRKRLGSTAREQRMVATAIKRARYMALLPYTSATL